MSIVEEYYVDLLDQNDGLIHRLNTTHSGKITMNVNRAVRGGGKINVLNGDAIDWLKHRVQVWYRRSGVEPFPLGVFLATAPSVEHGEGANEVPVELHDKTQILVEDCVPETFSLGEGVVVVEAIADLIASAGEERVDIADSDKVISSPMVWDAGTSKHRIINDLLEYINYFAIWVDGYGVFQCAPYSSPQSRPVSRTFERGSNAIHAGNWIRDQDIFSVPNMAVLIMDGDEEEEGIVGTAIADPSSPYSFENRGRWVVHVEDGIEAADQATIDDLAQRRLTSLSSPSATLDVDHLVVPMLLNDVVRFVSGNTDTLAVVERMDFNMRPGSLCAATWREVVEA